MNMSAVVEKTDKGDFKGTKGHNYTLNSII